MRTEAKPTSARRRAAAVLALCAMLLAGCLSPDQQADLDLINAARKANGKAALAAHVEAAKKAQAWSQEMARTGKLSHSGPNGTMDTTGLTGWCGLAENVGKGPSLQAIHDAFMASSGHRANILGRWNKAGTGVVRSGSTYWVTEIFVRTC